MIGFASRVRTALGQEVPGPYTIASGVPPLRPEQCTQLFRGGTLCCIEVGGGNWRCRDVVAAAGPTAPDAYEYERPQRPVPTPDYEYDRRPSATTAPAARRAGILGDTSPFALALIAAGAVGIGLMLSRRSAAPARAVAPAAAAA